MLTASYMTNYHISIRPEYLDTNCRDNEMFSFALGALDAPEVMPAGCHYGYKVAGSEHTLVLPAGAHRLG